ncbi:putative transmembrane protein [Toxoplasma gondii MAS]|uniref:Putative transmembrane protein n=1 Tax=Toxoplasma gondii MAS TaxID=943118 RepID=A0A086Q6P6_TOXGO|nr:putative transmembrane protein [Toxoplasma gondii MAS]
MQTPPLVFELRSPPYRNFLPPLCILLRWQPRREHKSKQLCFRLVFLCSLRLSCLSLCASTRSTRGAVSQVAVALKEKESKSSVSAPLVCCALLLFFCPPFSSFCFLFPVLSCFLLLPLVEYAFDRADRRSENDGMSSFSSRISPSHRVFSPFTSLRLPFS